LKYFNALALPFALIWSLTTIGGLFLSKIPVEGYAQESEPFFELFRLGDKFGITDEDTSHTKTVTTTSLVPAPHKIKALYRSTSDTYVSIHDGKETLIVPLYGRYKKEFKLISVDEKSALFRGFGKSYRLRLGFEDNLVRQERVSVTVQENDPKNEWRMISRDLLVDQMRDMDQLDKNIDLKLDKTAGFRVERIVPESILAQMGIVQGDILVSVNNKKLRSYGDALSIYKQIPNMRSIRINVLRNNLSKDMLYEIKR
jgi:membrane-associated protease RseP (regulator of RpoE activity)